MTIHDIEDPFERFVAFVIERENIRLRRLEGKPWPWTNDDILRTYRFTNINRENDRVSRHYQKTVRDRYREQAIVFPATVLYRWLNRPETCDAMFNRNVYDEFAFEQYMETNDLDKLFNVLRYIAPPYVTGAFIITGKPGYPKGEGVLRYFHDWQQSDWKIQWNTWLSDQPTLEMVNEWIRFASAGLGSFMAAQIVRDLQYLPFLLNAEDWWIWAASGPGSQRGLNVILGRPMKSSWNEHNWWQNMREVQERLNPRLEAAGIERLHAGDTQNCFCEFSKYEKARTGEGRPRQVYRHV